ncbi:non-homologous end-joining DNA ligase LigD [Rhodococcus koreensis]|uniref:non-homologous end-joining DNA ligase LigD n=1 Tax=Rhodococcus koreensis TaxID=99653 RepID=UPI0036DCA0AA
MRASTFPAAPVSHWRSRSNSTTPDWCRSRSPAAARIHVYAALTTKNDVDPSTFARKLAKGLKKDWPTLVTATMTKTDRRGKIFVDWSQNNVAKTTVAPYSLRGRSERRSSRHGTGRNSSRPTCVSCGSTKCSNGIATTATYSRTASTHSGCTDRNAAAARHPNRSPTPRPIHLQRHRVKS